MTEKTRSDLAVQFADGERPDGQDFRDIFDSCINKSSDGLSVDGDQNLVLARGIRLGNSAANAAGSLRFNSGQVQFNNGTGWQPIAATAAGFGQVGTTAHISFGSGNVGIGNFTQAVQPTYRFEVNLQANTSVQEQVRFGNAVVCNGTAAFNGFGMFAHRNHASNASYALRQSPNGAVHVNAAGTENLSLRQNDTVRLGISTTGQVIIGSESNVTGSANQAFQVAGDVFVSGNLVVQGSARKTGGGAWDQLASDLRVKESVRDLEAGLAQLRRVRPVRFRFNGRAGTFAGKESVGVIAQEIEDVLPDTIQRVPGGFEGDPAQEDLRVFDGTMLTFVLINAVKELAAKVDALETALAGLAETEAQ